MELVVVGVLVILGALAIVLRIGRLEARMSSAIRLLDRDRAPKEKGKRDELAVLRSELRADIESLRAPIKEIAANLQRIAQQQNAGRASARLPEEGRAEARPTSSPDDDIAQLIAIANRLVQQSAPTLDAFRASAGALAGRVSPYPNAFDGQPAAFIVEHRGAYYAIPNVVRPTRLPKEWFNRSDFGVNDEIRRVVILPRLMRRGNDYDVQEPGVFA